MMCSLSDFPFWSGRGHLEAFGLSNAVTGLEKVVYLLCVRNLFVVGIIFPRFFLRSKRHTLLLGIIFKEVFVFVKGNISRNYYLHQESIVAFIPFCVFKYPRKTHLPGHDSSLCV